MRAGICILLFAWAVYKVRLGLCADELLFVNIGDRIARGGWFFKDTWTVFQFTSLVTAPFLSLWRVISGSAEGEILFLRYVYLLIQAVIAVYSYFVLRRSADERKAFAIALTSFAFFFNFTAITYKSILYWCSFLIVLFMIRYSESKRIAYLIAMSLAYIIGTLCFPTMVVMLVYIVAAIVRLSGDKAERKKTLVEFLAASVLLSLALMALFLIRCDWDDIFVWLRNGLAGDGHIGKSQFLCIIENIGMIVVWFAGAYALVYIRKPFKRVRWMQRLLTDNVYFPLVSIGLLVVMCALRPNSISISRVWYVFIIIAFWFFYFARQNAPSCKLDDRLYLVEPGIFVTLAIVLATNQGSSIWACGLIFILYAIIVRLPAEGSGSGMGKAIVVLMVLGFIFMVPDSSGCGMLYNPRTLIDRGAAKGIFLLDNDAQDYNELYDVINENVSADDKVLLVGSPYQTAYGYMNTPADSATPFYMLSPISSLKVIEEYQERVQIKPNVIIACFRNEEEHREYTELFSSDGSKLTEVKGRYIVIKAE